MIAWEFYDEAEYNFNFEEKEEEEENSEDQNEDDEEMNSDEEAEGSENSPISLVKNLTSYFKILDFYGIDISQRHPDFYEVEAEEDENTYKWSRIKRRKTARRSWMPARWALKARAARWANDSDEE